MEHFCIITNQEKDPASELTGQVRAFLQERGKVCDCADAASGIRENTDCLLVLGGDGTMLQAARDSIDRQIPILGINLGTLGYLAEVEKQNWREALANLLSGRYALEKRMLLEGRLTCGAQARVCDTTPEYALNDIVITRDGSLQIINYNIYVNGKALNTFEADGIIVSTPTGSTAYNLSAGGPIVEPKAKLILLTPICPHTLSTRSIILAPEDRITIEIGPGRRQEVQRAKASFDGGFDKPMETGDRIEICRSDREATVIKLSELSFLETLHKKMAH
ncbi:MAG: NAD(+)/NADH kinase [Eubacteriales bacterium]|nr:NAD(+)/NADH kinase [Eubacteriales bacterium]